MADPISVLKEENFKLIERLSTEIQAFYLLISLLLVLDWFSKLDASSIFNFDLTLRGIDIGRILVFLVLFSFTMVFAPLLLEFIRFVLGWVVPSVLNFETDYDGIPYKLVKIYDLRRFALSENSAFLLDYVNKKEQAIISENANFTKIARLAFCFLVNTVISLSVGYHTHATVFWRFYDAQNALSPAVKASIGLLMFISILSPISEVRDNISPSSHWIDYPPLADAEMAKRSSARQRTVQEMLLR